MTIGLALLATAGGLLSAGCATEPLPPPSPPPGAYAPPSQPPPEQPPPPPVPEANPAQPPVAPDAPPPPPPPGGPSHVHGRPAFAPGSPVGYWIWVDPRGNWHLRTTSGRVPRQFNGRIIATRGGFINGLSRKAMAPGDWVAPRGRVIDFQFRSGLPIHGIVWRSTSGCNRFELYINGRPINRIFLGAAGVQPEAHVFERCQ